jgi:hypothetical protein
MCRSWCPPLSGGRWRLACGPRVLHPRSRRPCGWPALGLIAAAHRMRGQRADASPDARHHTCRHHNARPRPHRHSHARGHHLFPAKHARGREVAFRPSGASATRFCSDLEMSFEVSSPVDRSDLQFTAELSDSAGSVCWEASGRSPNIRAGRFATATLNQWRMLDGSGCAVFNGARAAQTTAFVDAELYQSFKEVRREHFEVHYTFLAPPLSPEPTAPEVVSLCWRKYPNIDHYEWGAASRGRRRHRLRVYWRGPGWDAVSVSIDYEVGGRLPQPPTTAGPRRVTASHGPCPFRSVTEPSGSRPAGLSR